MSNLFYRSFYNSGFHLALSFALQVIYRGLFPWRSVDPYGLAAQNQLTVTNLRVRLLQRQQCPCQTKHPGAASLPTDHYAIYDFVVKGSCLCNGHADHCVPARGYQPGPEKASSVVSFDLVKTDSDSLYVLPELRDEVKT